MDRSRFLLGIAALGLIAGLGMWFGFVGLTPPGSPPESAPKAEIPPSRAEAPPSMDVPSLLVPPVLDVAPEVAPEVALEVEPGGPGDQGVIASVVRKRQGLIQTCFEVSLRAQPTLTGRIVMGWSIVGGRVRDVRVVSNGTGSAALGECVTRAVRTFRFPDELTAEVAEFPWVLHAR